MKRIRPDSTFDREPAANAARRLVVVSRSAPARPRWRHLYVALLAVSGLGTALHLVVRPTTAVPAMDAALGLALFAVLVAWVRKNRVALTRVGEPEIGTGKPVHRRTRSHRRDEVTLPYDFRCP